LSVESFDLNPDGGLVVNFSTDVWTASTARHFRMKPVGFVTAVGSYRIRVDSLDVDSNTAFFVITRRNR
jgi:hypothetical protein